MQDTIAGAVGKKLRLLSDDPDRYLGLQGKITKITEEGGYDHINKLSHKYGGKDYPQNPGEVRVIYKIEPTRVWTMG